MASRILFLFDVDGTLTAARKVITAEMLQFMQNLNKSVTVGIVGGSDESKIREQLDGNELSLSKYLFSENGLMAYKEGQLIGSTSIVDKIGEDNIQRFINYCLGYMAKLELPCKRGTFVEFRNGMINICPVGRSCSQAQREEFNQYDEKHNIRKDFVSALEAEFPDLGMKFSIGGQISFDCFPVGWDKTYCLQFVENDFDKIIFFGDKTFKGGNDYEIFSDVRVTGRTVSGPSDTRRQVVAELDQLGITM